MNVATGEIIGRPCRSWRCDRCAVSNRRAFSKRLRLGIQQPGPEVPKLLTLTTRPGELPHESRAALSRRFASLRRRVLRMCPAAEVEYAGVVERTRRGAIHLHVVIRGVPFIPQPVWSMLAYRSGFGYVVDVRAANVQIGAYLTKALGQYLTKQSGSSSWPAHFRRIRFSRSWAPEWVSHAARRAHGGAPSERDSWALHHLAVRSSDQSAGRLGGAGQGRLAQPGGGAAADP